MRMRKSYHVVTWRLRRGRRRGRDIVRAEPALPDEVRHAGGGAVRVRQALQGRGVRVRPRGVDGVVQKRGRTLGRFFQIFFQHLPNNWKRMNSKCQRQRLRAFLQNSSRNLRRQYNNT